MALVSMRQLLDHAAEHGYGIPAFNVNNLEQVQAIMEAAAETDSPVIMQASAGARKYAGEGFLKYLIQAAVESYPTFPWSCTRITASRGHLPGRHQPGFSSVMMDGSLKEDGKTIADYDYNVDVTKKVVDIALAGRDGRRRIGLPGFAETMQGDKEDGHGADGKLTMDQLLTDPEQAADFVRKSWTPWPSPSAPATAPTSSRASPPATSCRSPASEIHARLPHPPGDARQLQRAAGTAGRDPRVRRRHEETYGVPVEEIQEAISSACARSTSTPTSAWP